MFQEFDHGGRSGVGPSRPAGADPQRERQWLVRRWGAVALWIALAGDRRHPFAASGASQLRCAAGGTVGWAWAASRLARDLHRTDRIYGAGDAFYRSRAADARAGTSS